MNTSYDETGEHLSSKRKVPGLNTAAAAAKIYEVV